MSASDTPAVTEQFPIGDPVRILDGPFQGFDGDVLEVHRETRQVIVRIDFFGRETAVELNASQVMRTA